MDIESCGLLDMLEIKINSLNLLSKHLLIILFMVLMQTCLPIIALLSVARFGLSRRLSRGLKLM